jgi:hypothetical protein
MRRRARFHSNQARIRRCKERHDLRSSRLPASHHGSDTIDTVNLKDVLRDVQPNRDNSAHGRSSSSGPATATLYGTEMPEAGAVHPIRSLALYRRRSSGKDLLRKQTSRRCVFRLCHNDALYWKGVLTTHANFLRQLGAVRGRCSQAARQSRRMVGVYFVGNTANDALILARRQEEMSGCQGTRFSQHLTIDRELQRRRGVSHRYRFRMPAFKAPR